MFGIISAVGGGLIRDMLAGRRNLLMTRELYATPVLIGCTLYIVLLALLPEYRSTAALGCVLFIFILRAAAIRWDLAVPEWLISKSKAG